MLVEIKGSVLSFIRAPDGWFESEGYEISPDKRICQTSPWYADYICDAPKHLFKIIKQ